MFLLSSGSRHWFLVVVYHSVQVFVDAEAAATAAAAVLSCTSLWATVAACGAAPTHSLRRCAFCFLAHCSPHALHSVAGPEGPLRHSGVSLRPQKWHTSMLLSTCAGRLLWNDLRSRAAAMLENSSCRGFATPPTCCCWPCWVCCFSAAAAAASSWAGAVTVWKPFGSGSRPRARSRSLLVLLGALHVASHGVPATGGTAYCVPDVVLEISGDSGSDAVPVVIGDSVVSRPHGAVSSSSSA